MMYKQFKIQFIIIIIIFFLYYSSKNKIALW